MTQLNLFGEEGTPQLSKHEDYNAFLEKFKTKKTTDDCYTPAAVYDAVVKYVLSIYPDWQGRQIVRPFYPGGDFENYPYPDDGVVIDNPPFSIYAKIVRYYLVKNIPFFLFAPGLTAIVANTDTTVFATMADVTYTNGALVRTSFITNHEDRRRLTTEPALRAAIEEANAQELKARTEVKKIPNIKFSPHIITAAMMGKIAHNGILLEINKDESQFTRKCAGRKLFGGGFYLSDEARRKADEARRKADEARRKADEARRKADEARRKADEARRKADEANTIKIELTAQEEEIVAKLSRRHFGGGVLQLDE